MARIVITLLTVLGVMAWLPSSAQALTLVTCPESGVGDRVFAIDADSLSSGTVSCFDYGPGNNLTGSAANDTMIQDGFTFFDYDDDPGQTDNLFEYGEAGALDGDFAGWVGGDFFFDGAYTSSNTNLYIGFKVGNNLSPSWAVFELTGYTVGADLTGDWYIKPVQGAGISHASAYGDGDVPPGVEPDPAVPEPASLLLLGSGLVGLAARARQRRRKQ